MLADPPAHKWLRLSNADLGLPGCTTYHVRPRAGLLGMLMGWWQVKSAAVARNVTSPKAAASAARRATVPTLRGGRLAGETLLNEPPKSPWHPFPLVELCVLAGIVLIVLGLLELRHRPRPRDAAVRDGARLARRA